MKKHFKSVFLLVLLFAVSYTGSSQPNGTYSLIEIPAPSLKNNLVGTKDVQKIGIYLPPSYNNSQKSYPVIYYMNGYTVQAGQYPPTEMLDSIMSRQLVEEMIFVELGGFNMFKGSMYANSPVTGNWEDFVVKDVISYVDKNYRTLAKRESRGITGHSMGGGACVNISMKYAELFSVACPMSPAIADHDSLMQSMFADSRALKALLEISKNLTNVPKEKFAEKLAEELKKYNGALDWVVGYGAAFAPDLSQPLKISLPYELTKEGKMKKIEKNYQIWEKGFGDLDNKVKQYKSNLLKYRHYALDCGYDDLGFIFASTKYYSKLLTDNQIPYSVHFFNGTHVSNVSDQLANRVMPVMSSYLLKE